MARIKLKLPSAFLTRVEIPVRITDLNYGNHLGNDSLVGLLHEARVQWLQAAGFSEMDLHGGSLILAGLFVEFQNESFYGDKLLISMYAGEMTSAGFELYYHAECRRQDETISICRARTDMVFFDYRNRRVVPAPDGVRQMLSGS